jgi:putative membrane protein (TIGR04086 family)
VVELRHPPCLWRWAGDPHPMTPTPGRIAWLAVFAGFFADFFISMIVGLFGSFFDPRYMPGLVPTSATGVLVVVLQTLSTGFGGWLAGRLAKHERVLHGVLVGGVSLISLLLDSLFVTPASFFEISQAIVLVFIGGIGGWLSRWPATPQQS